MLFEICEKRPFQKCMGWGGGGAHSFAHRAVNGTTHRAQAMLQRSLIIPNPIRCHRCPLFLVVSAGTNEATMAPTPENAPCWHQVRRPREIYHEGTTHL